MEENKNLDKKTQKIDKLINKTNSGKNAWTAGSLLHEIKKGEEYKAKQITSFAAYVRKELNISETKASAYIKVYLTYDEEDIGELMLVTHLSYLSEQNQNIRECLLAALRKIDKKKVNKTKVRLNAKPSDKNDLFANFGKKNVSEKEELRPDYDKEIITTSVNLLDSAEKKGLKITEDLADAAVDTATEISKRNFETLKLPNKTGQKLESVFFKDLCNLFEYEPVSEMGLVSLFCTMLYSIRQIDFEYNKTTKLKFKAIQYVRTAFPDAAIKFVSNKNEETILNVEFEFNTTNYLLHEHNKSDKECHLIITWQNDLNKKKIEQFGQILPPIISVKNLLLNGKIMLE